MGEPIKFSEETLAVMKTAVAEYPDRASATLPVLQAIQKEKGWVSPEAMEYAAELVGVSIARIREVATFYTMFHLKPVGKYHFQVCTNISCCLRGGEAIYAHCQKRLGIKGGKEVTEDGLFSLEHVECLAACEKAPAMLLGENYVMELDEEKIDELIAKCREEGGN
ncbi:MAG: NADH-quinone oxidoreductase subunit NuoE [Chrysiogenetes bacterium]|nr:NADH-quinone oxidoreductase subunit NuoE [Chrysiogenetes bacterium]